MSKKDWDKLKEDPLAPSKLSQEAKYKAPENEGLSDKELKDRLETYSKVSDNLERSFKILEIQKRYEEREDDKKYSRTKADVHYAQGIRSGLPHSNYESIKYGRELEDQGQRDDIAKEAKEVYQEGKSLSREFNGLAKTNQKDQFGKVQDHKEKQ